METIYLLVLSMVVMGVSFHYLSFLFLLIVYFLIVVVILFYDIKKGIIIFVFLFIYILRMEYSNYDITQKIGEDISVELVVREGIGRVKKVDRRVVDKNYYIVMEDSENGNYIIQGKLMEIEDRGSKEKLILKIKNISKGNKIKSFFEKQIDKITSNYSYELGRFYKGIILGEKGLIDSNLYRKFKYIGGTHILVISGLHISVIIFGVLKFLELLNLGRRVKYTIVWAVLSCYVAIIGMTPSIVRAYIMGSIFILGNIIYEKVDSRKSLLISFIVSLILVPSWFYNISFVMSYTALFSILFIYPHVRKNIKYSGKLKKLYETILLSLVIQLMMEFIFIFKFNTIQVFTFIPNLIIIPLGTLFIIISFFTLLLSFFSLEFLTIWAVNYIYIILIYCVDFFSKIPYLSLDI